MQQDLYSLLFSGREQDSQRYGVIFGVMNVINSGLFGFAASSITPDPLKIVSSFLGIGLCILWILAVLRMSGWVKWWETKLELLESQYLSTIECRSLEDAEFFKQFQVFRNRRRAAAAGCSTRVLGVWIPSIFIVAWASLFLFAAVPLACQYLGEDMERYFWPYLISVVIAVPITWLWSWCLYKIIDKKKSEDDKPAERIWWIPLLIGVFERGIITTLIGWQVSGAAGFVGAWVAVKTAGGWSTWSKGTTYARAVLFVGLLGNAMSIAFALLGGLMISSKG